MNIDVSQDRHWWLPLVLGCITESAGLILTAIGIFAAVQDKAALGLAAAGILVSVATLEHLFPLRSWRASLAFVLVGFYLGVITLMGTLYQNLPRLVGSLFSPVFLVLFFWGLWALTKPERR